MQIRYELTLEDMAAFYEYYNKNDPQRKRERRRLYIAFIIVIAALVSLCFLPDPNILLMGGMAAVSTSVMLAVWWLTKYGLKRRLRQLYSGEDGRGVIGTHRVEITDEGIIGRSEYSESKIAWGMITRIENTADHTFLFLGKAKGIVLPHHRITEGSLPAFLQTLGERYQPDGKLQAPFAPAKPPLPKLPPNAH